LWGVECAENRLGDAPTVVVLRKADDPVSQSTNEVMLAIAKDCPLWCVLDDLIQPRDSRLAHPWEVGPP